MKTTDKVVKPEIANINFGVLEELASLLTAVSSQIGQGARNIKVGGAALIEAAKTK